MIGDEFEAATIRMLVRRNARPCRAAPDRLVVAGGSAAAFRRNQDSQFFGYARDGYISGNRSGQPDAHRSRHHLIPNDGRQHRPVLEPECAGHQRREYGQLPQHHSHQQDSSQLCQLEF